MLINENFLVKELLCVVGFELDILSEIVVIVLMLMFME